MRKYLSARVGGRVDHDWDFAGTRRNHLQVGLSMTPAERLRWLEETVEEMRGLQGLARKGRPVAR